MFEMNHTTPPPTQIPTVMRPVPTKVQPTKPIPTRMTNKYTLLTNNDADDSNENDDKDTTKEVYTTELDLGSLANSNKLTPAFHYPTTERKISKNPLSKSFYKTPPRSPADSTTDQTWDKGNNFNTKDNTVNSTGDIISKYVCIVQCTQKFQNENTTVLYINKITTK